MKQFIAFVLLTLITISWSATPSRAADWIVPLAGNTFRNPPGSRVFDSQGALRLPDEESFSVYFHVDRPGTIKLSLKGSSLQGQRQVQAVVGDQQFSTQLNGDTPAVYPLGAVVVSKSKYVCVDLHISGSEGDAVAKITELLVSSDVAGLVIDYVRNNEGNMFYWGRRGPSVHLSYQLPKETKLTYAYSEITVPIGQDTIGAYYMANGFSEGYFGFQVNSDTQRRVLFSVWSPFHTDNPADIPEEQRVVTLAKGVEVVAKTFGNEGSGGQSYLKYPWEAGTTYRFLTEVKPDGAGNTVYTSWFGNKQAKEWRLIASFRRPQTDKWLTGFHSFLENFLPEYGHIQRSALYGNQWVCDIDGNWLEITQAKFTGDNTARGRHRLDYAGGSEQDHFFLRNCGFFDVNVSLDKVFKRDSTTADQPEIVFDDLPRG